jgi:hypothetical protein
MKTSTSVATGGGTAQGLSCLVGAIYLLLALLSATTARAAEPAKAEAKESTERLTDAGVHGLLSGCGSFRATPGHAQFTVFRLVPCARVGLG